MCVTYINSALEVFVCVCGSVRVFELCACIYIPHLQNPYHEHHIHTHTHILLQRFERAQHNLSMFVYVVVVVGILEMWDVYTRA